MKPHLFLLVALGAGAPIAACSSSSDGGPSSTPPKTSTDDAGVDSAAQPPDDAGSDATARPTPPPLPSIPNHGGPIVAKPEIVTITWQGDPIADQIEAFDDWMVASDFWKTMMAEWGVGPGTHVKSFRIPTAAPATLSDAQIQQAIRDAITAGSIPAPSANRIYTVYPPPGTVVTNFGSAGCQDFQAYHYAFDVGGVNAIYAVAPRCANTQSMSAIDHVTWGQSHEIMEAASDPIPFNPAWVITEQTPANPELGENADLCTGHPTKIDGHMVTRNWSNVAAAKGERPCVPAPPGPMFGAFATSDVVVTPGGASVKTTLHAYTTNQMGSFTLRAIALDPALRATLDKSTVADGDEVTLTITADKGYAGATGQNTVMIYALTKDYATRRHVVVRTK
jgi:hypothetical protein